MYYEHDKLQRDKEKDTDGNLKQLYLTVLKTNTTLCITRAYKIAESRDKTIAWINSRRDETILIHIEDITLNRKDLQCLTADLPDGPQRYLNCLVNV